MPKIEINEESRQLLTFIKNAESLKNYSETIKFLVKKIYKDKYLYIHKFLGIKE